MYGNRCGEFLCRNWGLKGYRLVYSGKCTKPIQLVYRRTLHKYLETNNSKYDIAWFKISTGTQLAIYKGGQGFALGTTENKSRSWVWHADHSGRPGRSKRMKATQEKRKNKPHYSLPFLPAIAAFSDSNPLDLICCLLQATKASSMYRRFRVSAKKVPSITEPIPVLLSAECIYALCRLSLERSSCVCKTGAAEHQG